MGLGKDLSLLNLAYFIVSLDGTLSYTNEYGEKLLNEMYGHDIKHPGEFFIRHIKENKLVFKMLPNFYGLKLIDRSEQYEFLVINLKEFEQNFADMLDISSFQHELKNPLTIIDGTAQLIHTKSDNDYIVNCSNIIKNECNRIKAMLENIHFLSEIKVQEATFNLIGFIDELCESMLILFPDITFRLETDPVIGTLRGDREKLFMAVSNLVRNACEAQKEGVVRITVSFDPTIKVLDKEKNRLSSMIKISIIDKGEGISESSYNRIFTPFFSTKNTGTGLGLVITKEIVEKHQGRIEITSQLGKGSIFTILLPQ